MERIHVKKLNPAAIVPTYGSDGAAGADLYACLDAPVTIEAGHTCWIKTGIAMEIPTGYVGLVCARSSMGAKRGLAPANKIGVIDCDYRGEVRVVLLNHSSIPQTVLPGERVAQLLIVPVATAIFKAVDELSVTERGAGGFGSTGR